MPQAGRHLLGFHAGYLTVRYLFRDASGTSATGTATAVSCHGPRWNILVQVGTGSVLDECVGVMYEYEYTYLCVFPCVSLYGVYYEYSTKVMMCVPCQTKTLFTLPRASDPQIRRYCTEVSRSLPQWGAQTMTDWGVRYACTSTRTGSLVVSLPRVLAKSRCHGHIHGAKPRCVLAPPLQL
jgi:hypothetical protein